MIMRVFRVLAIVSLFVDAYILLALIALQRMKREYFDYLPPFGRADILAIPRPAWLVLVAWTATLSAGCLWSRLAAGSGRDVPRS